MPQVVIKLEQHRVNAVLRQRGWAFNRQSGIGLHLTKPDPSGKVFETTGRPYRMLMTPVSRAHLDEILSYSRNIKEAVEQIEAISIGAQTAPMFMHPGAVGSGPGMDPAVMEKLMTQRLENEMAKLGVATQTKLDAAQKKLEELEAALKAATQPAPKAGKKASKKAATRKQPKGGVVARLAARTSPDLDENGDPILTPEQEKELAQVMGTAAKQD
jgi:hypothetical protein